MGSEERQGEKEKLKEVPPIVTTDKFMCKRCKKRECTYYEMHTRNADDPFTTYVTCHNCGKRWKFRSPRLIPSKL